MPSIYASTIETQPRDSKILLRLDLRENLNEMAGYYLKVLPGLRSQTRSRVTYFQIDIEKV